MRIGIQGRRVDLADFIKKNIQRLLGPDDYKPISFRLGMLINITKLYSLLPF